MDGRTDRELPRIDHAGATRLAPVVADALERAGAGPGARVAFTASNSPALLGAVYGCLVSGRAPVVLSAGLTDSERHQLLADSAPALTIDDGALTRLVAETDRGVGAGDQPTSWFRCRPVHYTSGTSGRPKGVWSGWLEQPAALALSEEERAVWDFGPDDVHLVSAPLSHSAPLRFALYTLLHGGSVVVPPSFDPVLAGRLVEDGQVTTAFMAPAHLQRLLDSRDEGPLGDTSRLRLLAHAGSSCPDHVRRAAADVFGPDVLTEFYGSTEGQFTVCPFREWERHPGTVGRARPGRDLAVRDGQIWCRVPPHARFTYWQAPEKTAATWDGDWFTVGDLGRLDDDGRLFLEGRRDDLIISGGVNVYPAEVERVLAEIAGVTQVVVFAADDERWGQKVCAAVSGTVTEQQVRDHAAAHLASYKRPKLVTVLESLPTTHSGKVDRLTLVRDLRLS
ncbi:class I adenylate-forming enzyme family protein [Nocardioides sp. AX2bis]|uniref:class I adenylate-forming enzyme family protein n=1 Tax=Nocardioides sp. AX2bis TaxID=2653157 RepID=UPI0012F33C3D|nr:AMP-binding protein [Nocardioides sp. AX2bis]VXC36608.1 AMP-dependent synthetase [Nocardioides sp. AX2bis]